ncbi:MAG: TetR/AcrR family transcriptional regulator [Myxococcota bacterium]
MRDKQREETRRKLYNAALEVFRRDGVDKCRIEDIAQIAEVSRAAFYFHFPTKDDVLLELLLQGEAPVCAAIAALPEQAPLEELLNAITDSMSDFWQGEPKLVLEVFSVTLRRTAVVTDREAVEVRALVGQRFRAAAERGELSPLVPSEALADFFLLSCMATMASWSTSAIMPLKDMLRGMSQLFLNGARGVTTPTPPPAPPPPTKGKKG